MCLDLGSHGLYDQIKVKPDDIATLFNELSKTHKRE